MTTSHESDELRERQTVVELKVHASSLALFDLGGSDNEFLAKTDTRYTVIVCSDLLNFYQVVLMVMNDSLLDLHICFVFDPGGSDVKDLKTDFFTYTTDVTSTTPNFERLANYLSYLENC